MQSSTSQTSKLNSTMPNLQTLPVSAHSNTPWYANPPAYVHQIHPHSFPQTQFGQSTHCSPTSGVPPCTRMLAQVQKLTTDLSQAPSASVHYTHRSSVPGVIPHVFAKVQQLATDHPELIRPLGAVFDACQTKTQQQLKTGVVTVQPRCCELANASQSTSNATPVIGANSLGQTYLSNQQSKIVTTRTGKFVLVSQQATATNQPKLIAPSLYRSNIQQSESTLISPSNQPSTSASYSLRQSTRSSSCANLSVSTNSSGIFLSNDDAPSPKHQSKTRPRLIDSDTPAPIAKMILDACAIQPYSVHEDTRTPEQFVDQFETYAEMLQLNEEQKRVLLAGLVYDDDASCFEAIKYDSSYEDMVENFIDWAYWSMPPKVTDTEAEAKLPEEKPKKKSGVLKKLCKFFFKKH